MISKIFSVTLLISIAGISQPAPKCELFQYYDPNVDNCASCKELCQFMTIIGTEKQCKAECSDYLTASTCTYEQYYDDVVSSCAPCSELCRNQEITGTTEDCSTKCRNYLKAQKCTVEEFFNVTAMSCSACSQLCSRRDRHGDTIPECFHKCPKYVEKFPPGNIIGEPQQQDSSVQTQAVSGKAQTDSSQSPHPGIIVVIVAGLIAAGVIAVILTVVFVKKRSFSYVPAPSTHAAIEEDKGNRDNTQTDIQMEDTDQTANGGQEEQQRNDVRFGVQERNPYASSAPCFAGVMENAF